MILQQHTTNNNYLKPLIIIGLLFFVLGFALGINTYLIPFLRGALELSTASSYLVMAASFASYVVFGIPSGYILQKTGYRIGITISFVIMALGMVLFIPSATLKSFPLFLIALFVGGMGQTLLQTSINPYVVVLGPPESGAKRISIMGIFNKVALSLGPVMLSLFLSLQEINIHDVLRPFYIISAILLICAGISFWAPLPEIEAGEAKTDTNREAISSKTSIFQFPYLFLGLVAVFMDVGVEIISLGTVLDYANFLHLPDFSFLGINLLRPEIFVSYSTFCMIAGYLSGIILIPKYLSQPEALKYSSLLGLIVTVLILFVPSLGALFLVAFLGYANAFLWPAIWPIAIEGLGKFTKKGASILVIGIVGGAIIPWLFGWLVDLISFHTAYLVCIPCYLYILFFSIKGHKIGKELIRSQNVKQKRIIEITS